MPDIPLEDTLLALVNEPNYKPVKPRAIAKKLGLDEEQSRDLKRAIKRLVKRGKLRFGASHLVLAGGAASGSGAAGGGNGPTPKDYRVTGIFRRTEAGYGFVRPAGSAPGADRRSDIYIAAKDAGDASSGDTVLLRLKKKRDTVRPNPEGEIIEIIERATHQFVGTYFESAGAALVQVDGKPFSRPILVGDPGAKNAQPDDKVVIEMIRFPSQYQDGEGVIVEVLGPRGTPGVDTLSIIREFNLPEEFAGDALDEARIEAEKFNDEMVPAGRTDLTNETIITIDPVDARDFDDAISLERIDKGHWRLGVHIADVSHFVRPRTALDREAMNRATSVYLPDRVLPMLPELISNGLASLQPDKIRYTKTVFIEFSPEGIPVGIEAATAAIKSRRRFSYEEVDEFLADRAPFKSKLAPEVFSLVERMHELAMMLRKRRMARGSLELTMRETKIDLDRNGQVVGAHLVENTESHQIIEEFMLAANEAVAQLFTKHELHFLRRVHHNPDPRKLKALTEFVQSLGIEAESLENRFELQRLLHAVSGQPAEHAVNYAVLRSLQRAIYSPEEEGHYALASEHYCHFTSPIRRYPDLTIHRLLDTILTGKKPHNDFGELAILGEHCSDRERRAEAAERELTKTKLLNYMSGHVGEELDGVVTGVEEFGLFVQGRALPAEGLVHVASLQDDYYRFDRASHTLAGHRSGHTYRLGDPVRVLVARVDVDRRELDFRIVGRVDAADDKKPAKSASGAARAASGRRVIGGQKGLGGKPRGNQGPRGRKKRRK